MEIKSDRTPKELGYAMPPEWQSHSATLLHWPSNRETWPGERLKRAENVYINIVDILHRFEPVLLFAENSDIAKRAEKRVKEREMNLSRIYIREVPLNDVWARDCGPIFIQKQSNGIPEFAITDWDYNAWGGKYPPYDDDNRIPQKIAEEFGIKFFEPGMVQEGGSIDVNGDGVVMTTESVLLNPNRNPDLSKEEIENKLKGYLGAEKIIWLKNGLKGDDTDGHIDDLCRFTGPNRIVASLPENESDINYPALKQNLEILERSSDKEGNPFQIVILPLPETKIVGTTVDGSEYVPASYANFYIANGLVLFPLYDERYDDRVLELFQSEFPGYEIRGVVCNDLVWGQGSIHCITQQLYGINL